MTLTTIWTGLWGNRVANKESLKVALAMLAVTALYEGLSAHFAPDYHFNIYEFIGTWTGLVCVWLSRTRNIQCWPWGIASSVALGFFFADIGLPGQEWLNLVYFTLIQVWSWPYWAFGGEARTELPVTTQSWYMRLATLAVIALGAMLTYSLIGFFSPGSFHPVLDSIVTSASVIAQYLLGRKKVESWVLWLGPVNMLSVVLFFEAGAYTVTALYVAYLVHAVFALSSWKNAKEETRRVEPVAHV